jgi:hypothetical protein
MFLYALRILDLVNDHDKTPIVDIENSHMFFIGN